LYAPTTIDHQGCIDLAIKLHELCCHTISYATGKVIFVYQSRTFAAVENSPCHEDRFWVYETTGNWERSTEMSMFLTEELNRGDNAND
jgi:hypothetical protein